MKKLKELLMTTNLSKEPFTVLFPSAQHYNKVRDQLAKERSGSSSKISVNYENDKLIVMSSDILVLSYPLKFLIDEEKAFSLCIVFSCGFFVSLPIVGERRTRNSFETLKLLFNKAPTKKMIFINQHEGKQALIRHSSTIKELRVEEFSEQD